MSLLKGLVNLSASDFESAWQQVLKQFDQRRGWIDELDTKLHAAEDSRVDKVWTFANYFV